MDGVIVREDHLVPGADRFVARLAETGHPYLILTNNSMYTTRDLALRLDRLGLRVSPDAIWTSALATAKFLADQRPGGTAFAIGEAGLTTALYEVGYTLAEIRSGLRRPRRDAHVQLRAYREGDPAHQPRSPLHRHKPGPDRPEPERAAAGHRLGRGAHLGRDRRSALLHRQAESAHDQVGAAADRRPFRVDGHDRRPHGHGHRHRHRGRPRDDPRAHRHHRGRARPSVSATCRAASSTRSPTSSTRSSRSRPEWSLVCGQEPAYRQVTEPFGAEGGHSAL